MRTATGTKTATNILILHEFLQLIPWGALVVISSPRGKYSRAMAILLSPIVPGDQLTIVHAPLLGEVKSPGAIGHIEKTNPRYVPLVLAPVTSGKTPLGPLPSCLRYLRGIRWPPVGLQHQHDGAGPEHR